MQLFINEWTVIILKDNYSVGKDKLKYCKKYVITYRGKNSIFHTMLIIGYSEFEC